jgi:hypothetical protein
VELPLVKLPGQSVVLLPVVPLLAKLGLLVKLPRAL